MADYEEKIIDRSTDQLIKAIDITDGSIASGTDSTALKGQALSERSTAIGVGSIAEALTSLAVGYGSWASGIGGTAIGTGATATGSDSVAVGDNASARANGAVQIGQGQNTTAETVQIKSTTILDPTGKIPFSALQENEVVGLSVNASNHLMVTYANGRIVDLGEIGGGGKAISDVEMETAGSQGKLRILYDDGTSQYTSAYIGAVLPTGAGGTYELKSVPELATYFNEKITDLENGYRFTVDGVEYIGKDTFDSNGNPIFEYQEVE